MYGELSELQCAAAAAAKATDVFLVDLVSTLQNSSSAIGNPYIMPDLVTFLAANGSCDASAAVCQTVEQLLLFSCTAAGKPTAQLGVTTSQLRDLLTKWVWGCPAAGLASKALSCLTAAHASVHQSSQARSYMAVAGS